MRNNITSIILAAGEGKRIGQPKWQLEHEGKIFLEIIVEKLKYNGLSDTVCVARNNSVPNTAGIIYSINQTPENGMLSSVFCGIQSIPNALGFLVFPVDHPFVKIETIGDLIKTFMKNPGRVVRPTYQKTPGHPIVIPKHLALKIPDTNYEGGLQKFIKDNKVKVVDITVDDQYILNNINTLGDIKNDG